MKPSDLEIPSVASVDGAIDASIIDGVTFDNLSAHPDWLSTLAEWHHQEWLSTVDIERLSNDEKKQALDERTAFLQKHLTSDVIPTTFVGAYQNQPIASASLIYHKHESPSRPSRQSLWLTNVYVVPQWRTQGLGQYIVNMAIDYCCLHKFTRLQLYTFDATSYYLKRGWSYERTNQIRSKDVDILSICPVSSR